MRCNSHCTSCNVAPPKCDGCITNYIRSTLPASDGTCISCKTVTTSKTSCGVTVTADITTTSGLFPSAATATCGTCTANCGNCATATTCNANGCNAGYRSNGGNCEACTISGCSACQGAANVCTACT